MSKCLQTYFLSFAGKNPYLAIRVGNCFFFILFIFPELFVYINRIRKKKYLQAKNFKINAYRCLGLGQRDVQV